MQVGAHHVELAADVVLAESHHRDVVLCGDAGHRLAEALTVLSEQRRRRERIAQVIGEKRRHLGAGLQFRRVAIQINPVRALDIQGHLVSRTSASVTTLCDMTTTTIPSMYLSPYHGAH